MMYKQLTFTAICVLLSQLSMTQNLPMELLKGQHTRAIGPAAMSGRVTSIQVSPLNQNVIFAGTASGGLWKSVSGGTIWEPIFDKAPTQSVGSVALNPKNPDEIWVGTGEGNPRNSQNFGKGIFKTIDGGQNWTCMGLTESRAIHRVIVHRDNPEIVWAAVIGPAAGGSTERGVFKTIDGGKNWRKVLFINDLTGCADLVVDAQNPQKLIASMWEYQRKPWIFNSGGKGSGLFVSFDGGETWTRRTEKDGLPEGNLGRIGVAIAPSNSNFVYALVEAKENALFRSTDGGLKFQKMATKGIGDRPFYYSEIYVDPADELRIYTIYTTINKSEDGGKNFEKFVNWDIHPDHHAFWISPTDPNFIINGNDGGLNITHDRGKTWHFAENLPIGQFYHLNIDNDTPYNIYGGLQDNGSWVGPSSVWKSGGIRNADWREVLFGDGFDVMPRPSNNRFLYAAYQGGNISYVDKMTGESRSVKPVHPDPKVKIRYNWNAALAQDPFNDCGIFYGSQFLHASLDCGESWSVISPDLSTNDTSKMHQDISGGLTPDATNAENHCTIIALAPSSVKQGIIWVGTDDGQLSKTIDGGQNWLNLTKNIPNFPQNAWIPQIELSKKNVDEAWVTVNNYRQNDWKPYLFYTKDGGKTWRNVANTREVSSYTLSFVQDSEVENLWFLGADDGLYLSINAGENWQKWTADDFPAVNVMDMKIHPRDGDLVLGTFGRAFLVMDDIRPLREIARKGAKILADSFHIFQPADAILAKYRSVDGPRFNASDIYEGENKDANAHFAFWVKPDKKEDKKDDSKKEAAKKLEKDSKVAEKPEKSEKETKKEDKTKVKILIIAENGDTVRTLKWALDTGLSRRTWYLEGRGVRYPSKEESKADADEPRGGDVLPGKYKIVAFWKGHRDSTSINVLPDMRLAENLTQKTQRKNDQKSFGKIIERATNAYERLREMDKTIKFVEDSWKNVPDSLKKDLLKSSTSLKDSISTLQKLFLQQEEGKGIQRDNDNIIADIWETSERIGEASGAAGENVQVLRRQTETKINMAVEKVNKLIENDFENWRKLAEKVPVSLFKEVKKVE
jgi:photosystem II stability/assembly factor-like uncharacterized protein